MARIISCTPNPAAAQPFPPMLSVVTVILRRHLMESAQVGIMAEKASRHGEWWTEERNVELVALVRAGLDVARIADEAGRTVDAIKRKQRHPA